MRSTFTLQQSGLSEAWDCLVWCPPGDNTAAICAWGPRGTDFTSARFAAGPIPAAGEVVAQRVTFNANVAGDLLQGGLINLLFDAPPGVPAAHTAPKSRYFLTTRGAHLPRRWRTTASSMTAVLLASATTNEGSVFSWEGTRGFAEGVAYENWASPLITTSEQDIDAAFETAGPDATIRPSTGVVSYFPFGDEPGRVCEVVKTRFTAVPFDETSMFAESPHLYSTNAYHGAYVIHRLDGPEQPLQNDDDIPKTIVTPRVVYSYNGGVLSFDRLAQGGATPLEDDVLWAPYLSHVAVGDPPVEGWQLPTPSMCVVPLNGAATGDVLAGSTSQYGTGVPPWLTTLFLGSITSNYDTSMDNVSQSVTIFRGLNAEASVQIKRLLSLEAAPLPNSPARPFMTPPIQQDPRAIEAYYRIAHDMEAVHPASANDFGSLLRTIADVASRVIPVVGGVASVALPEFAPEIGVAASAAAAVADAAKALAAKTSRPRPRPQTRPQPKPKAKSKVKIGKGRAARK